MESWTLKGTDTRGSFDVSGVYTTRMHEDLDDLSPPKRNDLSPRFSEGILDCVPDADNSFVMEDLNVLPDMPCDMRSSLTPEQGTRTSSAGSSTPRSPLLTPRTSQIEMLLSGWRAIPELESYQQVTHFYFPSDQNSAVTSFSLKDEVSILCFKFVLLLCN